MRHVQINEDAGTLVNHWKELEIYAEMLNPVRI